MRDGSGFGRDDRSWVAHLLRVCLSAWPARERHRLGPDILTASLRLLREARDRGRWAFVRELVGEAAAIVRGGLELRWRATVAAARTSRGGWTMGWSQDARFAVRTLARRPGFAAVAIGTLGLGIGAGSAVFSLADGVLFVPPRYERPEELVLVWNSLPESAERLAVAGPDVAALGTGVRSLEAVAFSIRGVDGAVESETGDAAHPVRIASITTGFFDVLGVRAAIGRTFQPSDGPEGGRAETASQTVVVLSDEAWRTGFAGDPAVVGRSVRLNGIPVRVVGVMPGDFRLDLPPDAGVATDVDVWLPLSVPLTAFHREPDRLLDQDSDNTGVVIGRLAGGATVAQAQEEVDRVAAALRRDVPAYAAAGLGFSVRPLQADATAHARPVLLALLAGALGVLVVTCLNLATLLLVRGAWRLREFAVRRCLGAGRGRLIRQLSVEGMVLGAAGLAVGLAVAHGLLHGLAIVVPGDLAPAAGLTLDPRSFGFGAVTAAVAVLVFAVLPGAGATLGEARHAVGAQIMRGGPRRARTRRVLVGSQVALSFVLAIGAGLLLRSVSALHAVDPGFEPEGALTFSVSLRVPDTYRSPGDRAAYMDRVVRDLAELPGVRSAGLVGGLPLSGARWTQPYGLPGQPEARWRENRADFRVVSSGYFDAMGTRLVEGRTFTRQEDLQEDERVVVVDEVMAERLAPGGSPLGLTIGIPLDGRPVEARVVGVVQHIRKERLDEVGREAVYVPYRQEASRDVAFVVRTAGGPEALAAAVRETVRAIDPRIPVRDLRTMDAYVDRAVAPRLFALSMLGGFALIALMCTSVGLYGVVAHEVGRRTREIGVRLAIGARPGRVVRGVVLSGVQTGLLGMAGGLVLALLGVRALRGLVFGVGTGDPATWAAVGVIVAGVTLLAVWLPARRAARLSPTEALRPD